MSNHVHLIISAKDNNVSDVLGDFKKFTGKQILKAVIDHPGESRREWMLEIFKKAGEANSRNTNYQFWQQDNQPKIIYTPAILRISNNKRAAVSAIFRVVSCVTYTMKQPLAEIK